MPKWIKSTWYSIEYGWEYATDEGFFGTKTYKTQVITPDTKKHLNTLIDWLNINQYMIKAIVPITQGLGYYKEGGTGESSYAWGYGVTPNTGFIVLAQQERDVSQEEFARLSRTLELKNYLPSLREKFEKVQAQVAADENRDLTVLEKKKLLGRVFYFVEAKEFDNRNAAESFIHGEQTAFTARRAELDVTRAALEKIENELKALEA